MKPAHVYLFTDHSRWWWRYRLFLPGGGHREASGFGTLREAVEAVPWSGEVVFKMTQSVPAVEWVA